jgi:Uma2 family endonuclease
MLVSDQSQKLTAVQYLELEQVSDVRHEYLRKDSWAITTTNPKHQIISGNIYVYLQLKLWESSYKVYADTKVKIDTCNMVCYSDISVISKIKDRDSCFETQPCLIVEIASCAAERIDRWEKWLAYQDLATLTEYIIVSQDRFQVEVYCRNSQGEWRLKFYGAGESVELLSVGLILPIEQIYEDVCF